ncbi:DUF1559 domain-containing protein [bacterium]|nr:MAG: DUF1559 domain-containing protein [bacterium]
MKHPRPFAEWIVGLIILGFVAAILSPPRSGGARRNARRSSCQSNLKQIMLACQQYQQDFDQTLPPLSGRENEGWVQLLFPYARDWHLFQCPEGYRPETAESTDYFYNARFAGAAKIKVPSQVILMGEGLDNSSSNTHLLELPLEWKTNERSPAQRHFVGANYAFTDGHVRWLRPTLIEGRDGVTVYSFVVPPRKLKK